MTRTIKRDLRKKVAMSDLLGKNKTVLRKALEEAMAGIVDETKQQIPRAPRRFDEPREDGYDRELLEANNELRKRLRESEIRNTELNAELLAVAAQNDTLQDDNLAASEEILELTHQLQIVEAALSSKKNWACVKPGDYGYSDALKNAHIVRGLNEALQMIANNYRELIETIGDWATKFGKVEGPEFIRYCNERISRTGYNVVRLLDEHPEIKPALDLMMMAEKEKRDGTD